MMNNTNKILIVDDDISNRELIKILCEAKGYQVFEAENGKQAIELTLQENPSLLIMDVNMPILGGYEATERLKNNEQTRHIPIILVTGMAEREEMLKGISKGANDFLSKPVDAQELELRIRNNLQIKEYHDLLENYNHSLEQDVQNKTKELQKAYQEAVQLLSLTAELKDPETGSHIQRVSFYAKIIGEKLGEGAAFCKNLYHAAPMHDIGKVGIPDKILLKQGPLTTDEWEIMKSHTIIGKKILARSASLILKLATEIALTHHEKWDGTGYPNALKGDQIPLSGRVMAIADVYDALRSKRPYKPEISHEKAVEIITEGDHRTRPEHFDPNVLRVFEKNHELFDQIFEKFKEEG